LDPVLRKFLFHIPNGGNRNPREAARLKRMGVRPGVSDYCLPIPRGIYHGLFVELKPKVRGYYPYISKSQRDWRDLMSDAGNAAFIVSGWERAIDIMLTYLAFGPDESFHRCPMDDIYD